MYKQIINFIFANYFSNLPFFYLLNLINKNTLEQYYFGFFLRGRRFELLQISHQEIILPLNYKSY